MVSMTRLPRLRIRFLKRGHIEIHLRFTYRPTPSPFYISNVSDATVSVPLSSVDKIRLLFLWHIRYKKIRAGSGSGSPPGLTLYDSYSHTWRVFSCYDSQE